MRRRSKRHPVLETAVFAAALFLAAFVGRELWRRRGEAPRPSPEPSAAELKPAPLNITYPPLPSAAASGRTETAVAGVPPLKLTRVQRRKPKPSVVPAPK
ncbi:MAG: hypothetical protein NDJ72_01635 [Elusimicrobia bacterium]|nr:hypothetical protein [Elusimicrobiota bacterium]